MVTVDELLSGMRPKTPRTMLPYFHAAGQDTGGPGVPVRFKLTHYLKTAR